MSRHELKSADGTLINARQWAPTGAPRADLLLCHGLAEHLGRYEWVGSRLAEAGYRVTGVELRGHGHSGGRRGHVMSWHEYVADLDAGARFIGGPFFLLAHSMGSLVSLDYLRTAPQVRGGVFTGTVLGVPDTAPAWKLLAGRLLSRTVPWLTLDSELNPSLICTDPHVVRDYVEDPLVFSKISARWFTEFIRASKRVEAYGPHYTHPVLAMWGEGDRIVPIEKLPPFFERWGGEAETRTWPGLYHEILNEPVRDQVLEHVLGWLEKQCAPA